MTAHVHNSATHGADPRPGVRAPGGGSTVAARPRWLLPGLLVALVVGGLVVAGVVSLSAVLYAGLFGGMILMHAGGHGHGGHGSAGHAAHGSGMSPREDLSGGSSDAQPSGSGSSAGLDERAANDSQTSETERHDQHSSHGCH